jgi:hypothetical protein
MDPETALRDRKVGLLGKVAEAVVDETIGNLPAYRQQDRVWLQVSGVAPRREGYLTEAGTCRAWQTAYSGGLIMWCKAQLRVWRNECRVHLLAAPALEQVTPCDGSAWTVVRTTARLWLCMPLADVRKRASHKHRHR